MGGLYMKAGAPSTGTPQTAASPRRSLAVGSRAWRSTSKPGSVPAWSGTETPAAPAGWHTSRYRSKRGKVSSCKANQAEKKKSPVWGTACPGRGDGQHPHPSACSGRGMEDPKKPQLPKNQELQAATMLFCTSQERAGSQPLPAARGESRQHGQGQLPIPELRGARPQGYGLSGNAKVAVSDGREPGHVLVGGSLLPAELPATVGWVDHLPGVPVGPG